jgi:hypothetical protein
MGRNEAKNLYNLKQKLKQKLQLKNNDVRSSSRGISIHYDTCGAGKYHDIYPKSEAYVRGQQLLEDLKDDKDRNKLDQKKYIFEWVEVLKHGSTEYKCVASMYDYGTFFINNRSNLGCIHLATPWLLEGAIRGSGLCVETLIDSIYNEVKPMPTALMAYWLKMNTKLIELREGGEEHQNAPKLDAMDYKDELGRQCFICLKKDSEILTLQQCMGCKMYCYCSQDCQTTHWEKLNHRGECKQLKILNKYHKPYAKIIRNAAIQGDTDIPELQKLRYKLGLERPDKDTEELGIGFDPLFDPLQHLVARKDGTVWTGSVNYQLDVVLLGKMNRIQYE